MPLTESLTLRITGDSAPLQRELEQLEQRLANFASKLSVTDLGRSFERLASRLSDLARPLEQAGRLFERLASQIQSLSQNPLRINVAPALQGLAAVSQQLDVIAAKLNALAAPRPFIPAPAQPVPQPIRRFASGGLVAGPSGYDRVPAMLSAGEFVLRESAVRQLGATFLHQLNQSPTTTPSSPPTAAAPISNTSSITNLGGIAIHVSRPADVNNLLRDLRHHEFRLQNRRG